MMQISHTAYPTDKEKALRERLKENAIKHFWKQFKEQNKNGNS